MMGRFADRSQRYGVARWPKPAHLHAEAVIHDNSYDDFDKMIRAMSFAKMAVEDANRAIKEYERKHRPEPAK